MPKEVEVTTVLNKSKKRDDWFLSDYSFNPYSSCSFNCLYCYIRGSKYGENLTHSLSVKSNAIEILDKQLYNRAKKNQYGFIVLSSSTDPYLKIESEYKLTREALKVIAKHKFPAHVITKSDLIVRDFDLLKKVEEEAILPYDLKELKRGLIVSFSFSTLKSEIAQIFEPGATKPTDRLLALEKTVDQGFLTGVNLMPLLPYISDTTEQLNFAFSEFKKRKVDYILPATITLFGDDKANSKTLMLKAIKKHFPELEEKYQKYFSTSSFMPKYYQNAFYKKMLELCAEYGLSNNILQAGIQKNQQ